MKLPQSSTTTGLVLALAIAGCAPPMSFRPAVPMLPGQTNEFGAALIAGAEAYPGNDNARCGNGLACPKLGAGGPVGGGAQVWAYHQFARWFDLGFVSWGSSYNAAGAGATFRFRVIDKERFVMGFDMGLGFAWADAAVPIAARLSPRLWIYTAPGAGIAVDPDPNVSNARTILPMVRLPLGLAIQVTNRWMLMVEAQPQIFLDTQTVLNAGVAASYRF